MVLVFLPNLQLIRGLVLLITVLAALLQGRAIALAVELEPSYLLPILRTIESDQLLTSLHQTCPADQFRKEATLFSLLGTEQGPDVDQCSSDIKYCSDSCLVGKNGKACFNLARALLEYGAPAEDKHYEPLFALACAIGRPSGCTNRAAGMRNGGYKNDPSGEWDNVKLGSCLRRSFKVACDGDDGWGCAMYGQSLQFGEGGDADVAGAYRAYVKSCEISPATEACEFAKSGIENIQFENTPE